MTAGRWPSWSIKIPQFLMRWWPAMKAGSTAMTQRPRDRVPNGSMMALPDPRRPGLGLEQIRPQTFDDPFFFYSTGMIYMHWVPTGLTVNKEYYVEVLREFKKRFRRKRPVLFKSGLWHFHQDNPPVHNSILLTDYLTKMSIKTVPHPPYSPDLAPCDFCLFPKLKENLRGERSCDAHTRGLPWGLPEVVGTVQVHCSRRRLLRSGLEFHEYTINKSAHSKKKSGNLFNEPCIWWWLRSTAGLNSVFFHLYWSPYQAKELGLTYYLPIA